MNILYSYSKCFLSLHPYFISFLLFNFYFLFKTFSFFVKNYETNTQIRLGLHRKKINNISIFHLCILPYWTMFRVNNTHGAVISYDGHAVFLNNFSRTGLRIFLKSRHSFWKMSILLCFNFFIIDLPVSR